MSRFLTRLFALSGLVLMASGCQSSQAPDPGTEPAAVAGEQRPVSTAVPEVPAQDAQVSVNTTPEDPASRHLYYSRGVHNDYLCVPEERCIARREPGEPSDPHFPPYWTSGWTMYRVFNNFETYPPPYASPPAGLTPDDYEVSHGASWYDSTYVPADGDGHGAMMEHYDKRCLPIFPGTNHYSCSFVSLGNKAWFLRYEDRPEGTPACCQFSLRNHPPRPDFIKHLPYNAEDSQHLGNTLQAYAITMPPGILFAYAFWEEPAADSFDKAAAPYRHPQSFYFSGQPSDPPNAPIVSQNYTDFRMERPDPAQTWDRVAQMCPVDPEWCCLFESDCPDPADPGRVRQQRAHAEWSNLSPPKVTQEDAK